MNIQLLEEGCYFHIYNRGVNSENIFKEERNDNFFLQQYAKYCSKVFDTIAYALLKNHFHLLVYVKENVVEPKHSGEGVIQLNATKQIGHFFNSYAQSINKFYARTGPLFESPFERKKIDSEDYLTAMILYCHFNPQIHGLVDDFRKWSFTSYHSILNNNADFLSSETTLNWFNGFHKFEKAHELKYYYEQVKKFNLDK